MAEKAQPSLNPAKLVVPAMRTAAHAAASILTPGLSPDQRWRGMFPGTKAAPAPTQPPPVPTAGASLAANTPRQATPSPTPGMTPPTPAPVPGRTPIQARQPQAALPTETPVQAGRRKAVDDSVLSRAERRMAGASREYDRKTPGVIGASGGGTGLTPEDAWRKWFPTPGTKPADEAGVSQAERNTKRIAAMTPGATPAAAPPAVAAVAPMATPIVSPGMTPNPASMNPANANPAEAGLEPSEAMKKTMRGFAGSFNPAANTPSPSPNATAMAGEEKKNDENEDVS